MTKENRAFEAAGGLLHVKNQKAWRQLYSHIYKRNVGVWGAIPDALVRKALKHARRGKALDLGVGEGRNALLLARKGFQVTGVDFMPEAIRRLRARAKREKLRVKGIVADIAEFRFPTRYDLILSTSTFHALSLLQVKETIAKMKRHTNPGGLNVISVFTKKNPAKHGEYLFSQNELRHHYGDWQIVSYREGFTAREKHGKGPWHRHHVAEIIARKP